MDIGGGRVRALIERATNLRGSGRAADPYRESTTDLAVQQGNWTVAGHAAVLNEPGGRLAVRFQAHDLNLVMVRRPAVPPSRCGSSWMARSWMALTGATWESDGRGIVTDQCTYQLIRQPGRIEDRVFEMESLDARVEGCASRSADVA